MKLFGSSKTSAITIGSTYLAGGGKKVFFTDNTIRFMEPLEPDVLAKTVSDFLKTLDLESDDLELNVQYDLCFERTLTDTSPEAIQRYLLTVPFGKEDKYYQIDGKTIFVMNSKLLQIVKKSAEEAGFKISGIKFFKP